MSTDRMKTYRLLNDGETILDTDLCYGFDRKWITPQDTIGMPFNSEWIFPIKREVPSPQWQTGEIPEPTGLCIVVMETNVNNGSAIIVQAIPNNQWEWCIWGNSKMSPNQLRVHAHYTTGRWYIQAITLPL